MNQLRARRDALEMTRGELADLCGCSSESIKLYEAGKTPTRDSAVLRRIDAALGYEEQRRGVLPPDPSGKPAQATIRAVMKYAEQLRTQASRQMAEDCYARPFYPTTAAVRMLLRRVTIELERNIDDELPEAERAEEIEAARRRAPQATIDRLRQKAAEAQGTYREEQERSERALQRHMHRQAQHDRDVAAMRAGLSLGARLDRALTALLTLASAPAQTIDADRVRGGDPRGRPPWVGDPSGYARDRAHRLIQHIEAIADDAHTRKAA